MKIKEGFDLRKVCDEYMIIASGRQNIDFSRVITLNDSAAVVWKAVLGRDFTVGDMAEALIAEYDVEKETALHDAADLLAQWQGIGIVED